MLCGTGRFCAPPGLNSASREVKHGTRTRPECLRFVTGTLHVESCDVVAKGSVVVKVLCVCTFVCACDDV